MKSILQTQGLHHITLNGADKKTSINFWQDILGMRFIFEQPNLDHKYFELLTDTFRSPHIWKWQNNQWKLRNTVF